MNSLSVPYSGLNIVKARGKWYVQTRCRPSIVFIRGYVGSKEDLYEHLRSPEVEAAIIASGCTVSARAVKLDAARKVAAARLVKACRNRSSVRSLECTIDVAWVLDEMAKTRDKCAVTGLPFDFKGKKGNWHKNPFSPSLDRINRSIGYVPGNVRVVLTGVNIAINEWGLDHFKAIARSLDARPGWRSSR